MYDVFTMYYILGLGNPDKKYEGTRHNIGRDALSDLVSVENFTLDKPAQALVTTTELGGEIVTLALPQTYMNRSGDTARFITEKLGVPVEKIVVVYDDVALPFGTVRLSVGKGDGGHNGIKSIAERIGKEFIRVRIGVASKSFWTGETIRPAGGELNKHVLGKFSLLERNKMDSLLPKVHETLALIVSKGITTAMNKVNVE